MFRCFSCGYLGWHFGDINVTMTLNLDHTTHIVIASGPHNTSILCVVWSRFNVTVTLMSPKCHPATCASFVQVNDEMTAVGELDINETQWLTCCHRNRWFNFIIFLSKSPETHPCYTVQESKFTVQETTSQHFTHYFLVCFVLTSVIWIVYVDGTQVEGVHNIRNAVFHHFSNHFKSVPIERPYVEDLSFAQLNNLEAWSLVQPFSSDEVKLVVWDCNNYKSLGPNGITFGFIKEFWSELKDDFMRFLTEFHRNGKLTKGVNSTFIALIPKADSPQRLNEFHHISLVRCMYKVLAKVLANRLRAVIGSVISDTQSAFVKGKHILDGILITNEAVDEAHRHKNEMLLFKVNFEKAYDSMDLQYLESVMVKMNFLTLWRKWIVEWRWMKVRKIQEGGLNCVGFFFFFSYWSYWSEALKKSFWSDVQILNAADKNLERKERHKAIIQVPSTNRK